MSRIQDEFGTQEIPDVEFGSFITQNLTKI
jgi:hypothetical protein